MELKKKNIWVNIGAGISILLIIYCLIYIYNYYTTNDILWHYPKNIKPDELIQPQKLAPNEIGDSISGILNPVIGLLASILTFLAFYMQKRANDEIQTQFKTQQFESQFYEMLRFHKENIAEIELNKNGTLIKGRMAFHQAVLDLHYILENVEIKSSVENKYHEKSAKNIFYEQFNYAYRVFFWNETTDSQYHTIPKKIKDKTNYNWHAILGHYYRHLFHLVKFIAKNKELSYSKKMSYLKIVRAQLSNYEQIMLFYNWIAEGYGSAWEEESENGNHFFTKYKMIHNLWYDELYRENFLFERVNALIDKYNVNPQKSPLFEFQKTNFKYKIPIPDIKKTLADQYE